MFDSASASLAGFTDVEEALAFETLVKVRSVDCLLPDDMLGDGGWARSVLLLLSKPKVEGAVG